MEGEQNEGQPERLGRHPILERLERDDYDLNGQSLDYEPNLEFDDTDLKQEIEEELEQLNANLLLKLRQQRGRPAGGPSAAATPAPDEQQPPAGAEPDEELLLEQLGSRLSLQQSPTALLEPAHELLEENFEEAFRSGVFELEGQGRAEGPRRGRLNSFLKSATGGLYASKQGLLADSLEELKLVGEADDFSDIARHNCVEVAGDDLFGRRIVTIYACRLPSETKIHHLRLLKYIMFTLDRYVENDYCLVYFHFGLNSANKPKLSFLYAAYKAFDRKYKKNLKALFLVHPTNFIRVVWQLFKPVIR